MNKIGGDKRLHRKLAEHLREWGNRLFIQNDVRSQFLPYGADFIEQALAESEEKDKQIAELVEKVNLCAASLTEKDKQIEQLKQGICKDSCEYLDADKKIINRQIDKNIVFEKQLEAQDKQIADLQAQLACPTCRGEKPPFMDGDNKIITQPCPDCSSTGTMQGYYKWKYLKNNYPSVLQEKVLAASLEYITMPIGTESNGFVKNTKTKTSILIIEALPRIK